MDSVVLDERCSLAEMERAAQGILSRSHHPECDNEQSDWQEEYNLFFAEFYDQPSAPLC